MSSHSKDQRSTPALAPTQRRDRRHLYDSPLLADAAEAHSNESPQRPPCHAAPTPVRLVLWSAPVHAPAHSLAGRGRISCHPRRHRPHQKRSPPSRAASAMAWMRPW